MEYEIKIVMHAKNADYEKEMEAWKDRNKYNDFNQGNQPQKTVPVSCLETRVDQEQFEAIRKAALEVF